MCIWNINILPTKEGRKVSRRKFLKMLGSGALILGIGGLNGLYYIMGKRINAQESSSSLSSSKSVLSNEFDVQIPCNYIIYNTYQSTTPLYWVQRTSDGEQLVKNGSQKAELVIQTALDQRFNGDPKSGPGYIYMKSGNYKLSSGFTGFNIASFTKLVIDPTAEIIVPNGYRGYVFKLHSYNADNVTDCIIDGGFIREDNYNAISKRQWNAIEIQASSNQSPGVGVVNNRIMNLTIYDANIGIKINIDGSTGFVNGNLFEFIKMYSNNIFIEFQMDPMLDSIFVHGKEDFGIHRNHFKSLQCECDSNTKYGIKDIRHNGNTFIGVNIWDIEAGGITAISSNIHTQASGTIIIAGIMTNHLFTDYGQNTKILDEWQGFKIANDSSSITSVATEIGKSGMEKIGFFGANPVGKQQYDPKLSKLDNIYNALKAYGMLS